MPRPSQPQRHTETAPDAADPQELYRFLKIIGNLKQVPRSGWVLKGVHDPESVAAHAFRTTMMALVFAKGEHLDDRKVIIMAMISHISDAVAGDIIREHGTQWDATLQHHDEQRLVAEILPAVTRTELAEIFTEYREQKTPESQFVKEIDKLEMVLQALEYEEAIANPQQLREFWENASQYVRTPQGRAFLEHLKRQSQIPFETGTRSARSPRQRR